ncbi:G-patch domain and KOW motifs-containing protein [Orussus abietinus]|uniref:G-patch domain and KOW motifs-containing protein n=1 Tax=Orussus abietinus TaxID=222816 RepID=UPI0006255968|nr:G-patch domain and KOW motifs-containing protein [Orussus abietinus]XP_012281721.1 G-patch domain and KOW motifs-containing protein [Orussus abietinus]
MAEEGKKVSFGFSKSLKKPTLKNVPLPEEKKVDYIECLDEKSIKVFGEEEKKDEPLVIPMLGPKTWHDRIINKVDADIFETKEKLSENDASRIKDEKKTENITDNGVLLNKCNLPSTERIEIKMEIDDDVKEPTKTLEEQAAKEIIEELTTAEVKVENNIDVALPVPQNESLLGQEESTLEDYEQIPIDKFGVAMLRGMGWQPGKGIGRNEKVVAATIPELRPKGMGLGADKVTLQKQKEVKRKDEEQLKLVKGAFVKIIAGKYNNNYGEIEGLDDDAGRLIVKLALGGNIVSLNEFMVQAVTKDEYSKNAKVLNSSSYEKYKDKHLNDQKPEDTRQESNDRDLKNMSSDENNDKLRNKSKKSKSSKKRSKSKKRRKHSSSEDSSLDRKSRKRKDTSDSDSDRKSKKSKKSKKHKRQDSSSERASRKSRKKDKERERRKDRSSHRISGCKKS